MPTENPLFMGSRQEVETGAGENWRGGRGRRWWKLEALKGTVDTATTSWTLERFGYSSPRFPLRHNDDHQRTRGIVLITST